MSEGLNTHRRPRVCVVIPTYNNDPTLRAVLADAESVGLPIIAVDDGSTDATAAILGDFPAVTVVTHGRNMGKGAALASGFARAREMGFDYAVTMDSDGQHLASDIPRFLAAIESHPGAIIIGVRDLAGRGRRLKSRITRLNSDFWTWVETGRWVHDTQSGFRAYPLELMERLALGCARYDYEIESLVKAVWMGAALAEVPIEVRYDTGSASHFRPLRDFALVARLNARLVAQKFFLPLSLRRQMNSREYGGASPWRRGLIILRAAVVHESNSPRRFGLCVGLGVCCGILPVWGFQMALAAVAAHRLRLSKPIAVAASNISVPVMIPFILYGSLATGRLVLGRSLDLPSAGSFLDPSVAWAYAAEYLVGSVVLAAVAGFVAGLVSYAAAKTVAALGGRR